MTRDSALGTVRSVTVADLLKRHAKNLALELVCGDKSLDRPIRVSDLNRPGLALTGFLDNFRFERVQIIGIGEQAYCRRERPALKKHLAKMLAFADLPCLIITHNAKTPPVLLDACRAGKVPLLRSRLDTAALIAELSEVLEESLAQTTSVHGVLVVINGLGVLIQGEAGIGKSECALELVKRGHILVADDVVDIQHRRGGILRGICPDGLRHYMEIRGPGIIDAKLLFGVGSILDQARIELVVRLEPWKAGQAMDRTGLEAGATNILGVELPLIRMPVSPGRHLAALIEVTALNYRLKSQGYIAAEAINKKILAKRRP